MIERFAGRFLLLRRLGTGGMGEVFLARDTTTGLECALKRLHVQEADLADSVRREFQALTRVRHPSIVAVHEFGVSPDGVPYYTMEYVPGLPSHRALASDDRAAIFYVAARVAHGLEVLHAANVVHGDLKPENLIVLPGDRPGALPREVKLVDFGLATLIGRTGQSHAGTAGFAAPEIVAGQTPSPSNDLYGLGATLYALLARRPPFGGETVDAVLRRQRESAPSTGPLEAAGAPGALIQLIYRLMAASPAERPRDAREVRRALEAMHPAARRPLAERIEVESIAGRESELTRFESWWSRTPLRPRLIVLSGVAGAGKSALLTELAHRATLAGRPVFHLSSAAFEEPRATAMTLLRRLALQAGADADATLGLRDATSANVETWTEAASGWIATLSRAGSPVVLIDDAERLDEWSRAWVRRLISRPEPSTVAWLWARRRADRVPEDEAMMVATGLAERIELPPLSREGLARLAAVRLGDTLPPSLEHDLWSRSGGHPGLAVELLRRAVAAGAVVEDEAGMRVDEDALSKVGAPADYEESLLARCAALEPRARMLAEALAVWRAALSADEIARLLPEAGADAIESVIDSGLATRQVSGAIQLWPPLLADRLAEEIPNERRRELHRMALGLTELSRLQRFHHLRGAGEARAALDEAALVLEEGPDTEVARLAASLAEAEVPDAAAEWHERAARQFMERRLFVPAAHHLRRALELEPSGPRRADRWVMLCRAAQRTGQPDEVFRIVETASRESLPPGARARMLADESMARLSAGQRPEARERALEALALAEASKEPEAEGVAAQTLGYLDYEA
ncbi:MAG TPA: protein kinase, partial [Candidatus Eisenbacteria bacterium]|nr:protein kinase [Candidatus Eisenbacteria bacterium]